MDLMIDLETLDTAPTAVVLSIGAVVFDPYTGARGPSFYKELTNFLEQQTGVGRTISPGTIFANPAKPHHWTEAIKLALQTKPQTVQPTHTWDESAEKLHDILAKI